MKNPNLAAALVLALGLVISSCILSYSLNSLGQSIARSTARAKPQPVLISDRMDLKHKTMTVLPRV